MATVLVVDDDPKLQRMLQRTLAYEGFQVRSATNGYEALAQVQAQRPDVMVLDAFPSTQRLAELARYSPGGEAPGAGVSSPAMREVTR
jgi:two-component system, OmpR family, response regulator MprA